MTTNAQRRRAKRVAHKLDELKKHLPASDYIWLHPFVQWHDYYPQEDAAFLVFDVQEGQVIVPLLPEEYGRIPVREDGEDFIRQCQESGVLP